MRLNQKGFSAVEILIVIVVITLVGFVGWRVYDSNQDTNEASETATQTNEQQNASEEVKETKQEEKDEQVNNTPEGWVEYTNTEFGISFSYPSEWGEVTVGEPHYGSEQQAGPRISISFTDCESCKPDKSIPLGASTPEIAVNSKDFGGVGTSRPLAIDAGYTDNGDGSLTVYKQANNQTDYTSANTLELSVIGEVLFIRQNDSFHNLDTTRAIVNITDSSYSGVSLIIHDTVGETSNSDLLKSIIETISLN